ncbi:MAG: hypothetical protein ACKVWV_17475 [Planctomycetota bacterium]
MKLMRFVVLASASLLSSSTLGADVLVIAADSSGDFTSLQAAVDAALNGDTLLVKSGTYVGPTIIGKQLNVVADANAEVVIEGSLEVHGLLGDSHVLLAGLHVVGAPDVATTDRYALRVSDSLGSIRVQECELTGAHPSSVTVPLDTVSVANCPNVSFVRTVCTAVAGGGGSGVEAVSSSIAILDSSVNGGSAQGFELVNPQHGKPGGDGFDGASSFLFTSGSSYFGGAGSHSSSGGQCNCGGLGGSGISLGDFGWPSGPTNVTSTAAEIATATQGAPGGSDPGGACGLCINCDNCSGPFGQPYYGESAVTHLGGAARMLSARNVAREQTVLPLRFRGMPGDKVALCVGKAGDFRHTPGQRGVELVEASAKRIRVGKIAADGMLTYFYAMPALANGEESRTLFFQALHESTSGQFTLGSPLNVVVLDAAL